MSEDLETCNHSRKRPYETIDGTAKACLDCGEILDGRGTRLAGEALEQFRARYEPMDRYTAIRMNAEDRRLLENVAASENVTISQLLRDLIDGYLGEFPERQRARLLRKADELIADLGIFSKQEQEPDAAELASQIEKFTRRLREAGRLSPAIPFPRVLDVATGGENDGETKPPGQAEAPPAPAALGRGRRGFIFKRD